jgi:WD40 repeat protein/serine/threonine protein kinase
MQKSENNQDGFQIDVPTILGPGQLIPDLSLTQVDPNVPPGNRNMTSGGDDRESSRTIGEFTVIREIGRGGMGVVYEATQASLNRRVALKTLPISGRMDQRQIQRFQNEARAAAQLQHPNIVPVFSIGMDAGVHFYAMQFIPGYDLAHYIRHAKTILASPRAPRSGDTPRLAAATTAQVFQPTPWMLQQSSDVAEGSTLSVPLADFIDMMADQKSSVADRSMFESILQIGIQAAEALHYAHQVGIVHRDIKPSNLMLDHEGKLWVTDFGLAQIQGAGALTMTGEVIGTLRYMSPEQPLGQRVLVDQRTDIYSLGVTLYELLTFKKAFGGETPKEIIRQVCFDEPVSIRRLSPRVPEDLETIVLKAMAKNPADRYQSARELADDLERFRADQPINARRPTLVQQGRRWIRRHTALATAAAAGIVILLLTSLTATGMIWNSLNAETQQRQRAESLLDKSEGLRLIANSALVKEENPGLALLLAVKGAELSPGVDANTAILNAMGSNHELRTFSPRKEITETICVSPDGTRAVTTVSRSAFGRGSFPAVESDLKTGETLRSFDDGSAMTSAGYSSNGKLLLMTSAPLRSPGLLTPEENAGENSPQKKGVATLWDAQSGVKKIVFNDSSLDVVLETQFSPDSSRVVLPGNDNSVKVYSTTSGQLELSLKGHTARILSTAFSVDGKRLISVSEDSTIRIWDAGSGAEQQSLTIQTDFEEIPSAFLTAENQLVISTAEGTELRSLETGKRVNPQHWPESNAVVSRDGGRIALYSKFDKHVSIWDCRTLRRTINIGEENGIVAIAWSADGRSLMVATTSRVIVHLVEDGAVLTTLLGHSNRIVNAVFTPDSQRVVTTSYDMTVRVWSVESGFESLTLLHQPAATVPSAWAVSADSKYVAAAEKPVWNCEVLNPDGLAQSSPFSGRASRDSFDSDRLITLTDHETQLWDSASSRKVASFQIFTDKIGYARTVPGTDVVAILLDSGKVILWNTVTAEQRMVGDTNEFINSFDVHPDNGNVVIGMRSGRAIVVSAKNGEIAQTFNHDNEVLDVKYSLSGTQILTVDSRETTRIWGNEQAAPTRTFVPRNEGKCDHASFSADEKSVVTWNEDEKDLVRCWSLETGELVKETPPVQFPEVVLHSSQPIVAIASPTDGLMLWNWLTGELRQITQSPSKSPNFFEDRLIAIEASPGFRKNTAKLRGYQSLPEFARSTISIRKIETGEILFERSLKTEPWSLKVSQTSGKMLFSNRTYNVATIRTEDHQRLSTVGNHAGPIVFVSIAGRPEKIICASTDGVCTLWDFSGRFLHRLEGHLHPVIHANVSPDGLRLATFDEGGLGRLWNMEDGTQIMELPGHTGAVHSVQFSTSGKLLVTASSGSGIRIWDLIARTEKTMAMEGDVLQVELSPDETQLMVVSGKAPIQSGNMITQFSGGKAMLVSRETGVKTPLSFEGTPTSGRFSPDGKLVAVLSREGAVKLFNSKDGQTIEAFNPNRRTIYNMAYSPDGKSLLVHHDLELSLWDLQNHTELLRTPAMSHTDIIGSLQTLNQWKPFSPDGNWIISATHTLQKWPRNPLIDTIKRIPRPLTEDEKNRFSVNLLSTPELP